MKSKILFLLVGILFCHWTAQGQELLFEKTHLNIGNVEMRDSIWFDFTFTNTSNQEVFIQKLNTECVCTVVDYPRYGIKPDTKESIKILYLPYKAGQFMKNIEVVSQSNTKYDLRISGELFLPTSIEKEFSYSKDFIRFRNKILNLGVINTQNPVTRKFEVYNPSKQTVAFSGKVFAPHYIKVLFDSTHIIRGEQKGAIYVTYDAAGRKDIGHVEDSIYIHTLHASKGEKVIGLLVSAVIEEFFGENGVAKKPEIQLPKRSMHLGTFTGAKKDSIMAEIEIKNVGEAPLKILKIVDGYGAKTLTEAGTITSIAPNETAILKVWFMNLKKRGYQSRTCTIYSNDPKKHIGIVKLTANLR